MSAPSLEETRAQWRRRWKSAPPPIRSADILSRLMAWKEQAEAHGDLDRATRRRIAELQLALRRGASLAGRGPALSPGSVVTRDWRGAQVRVEVVEDGFMWEGRRYASLSQVARAVTGARWSGPRFFGVEETKTGARRQAAAL